MATQGSDAASDCQTCSGGTYSSADRTQCLDCDPGTAASAGSSSCTACLAGTSSGAAASTCDPCDAGWHQPDGGKSECFRCPAGMYSDEGATSCEACPIGTYRLTPAGATLTSCEDCGAGTYAPITGTVKCTDCPAGTAHNQARATSLAVCDDCNPGFYAPDPGSSQCIPCPAGRFANSTASSECFACPHGTYSDEEAAVSGTTCTACPFGQSTAEEGSTSISDCLSCQPGSYRDNATQTCLPCPPGTTSSSTSTVQSIEACVPCDHQAYAPSYVSDSCTACPTDTTSYTGWSHCTPCDSAGSCDVGPNEQLCSGYGTCYYGHCTCEAGWSGSDCATGSCPTCYGLVLFDDAEMSSQEGKSVTVTFTRTLGTQGADSVELVIHTAHPDNTATNADVGGVFPMLISFAHGEASQSVVLTFTDDGVYVGVAAQRSLAFRAFSLLLLKRYWLSVQVRRRM